MNTSPEKVELSVIICTHNPRTDYLKRVLEALQRQTLALDRWELLLIDNCSILPVAHSWDISWHLAGRHIREEELGLTPARLRGIRESQGDVLIFADDDNVLAADYLEQTIQIGHDFPFLGAWGGLVSGEFESPPPAWTKPFQPMLALRSANEDLWSNDPKHYSAHPFGAGMCVRRPVVERYASEVTVVSAKRMLDRRGQSLISCGDRDILLTSRELRMGFGVFCKLSLTHLIPKLRLTEDYLVALHESNVYSDLLLAYCRGERTDSEEKSAKAFLCHIYTLIRLGRRQRRFYLAGRKAQVSFAKWLQTGASLPPNEPP